MGSSTATRPAPASGRAATGEPQNSGYQTLHQGTLGNLALAMYLAGGLCQRHGQLHGDPPGTCFGQGCYR